MRKAIMALALCGFALTSCTSVTVRKMGGCGMGGKSKDEQLAYWGGEGDQVKRWYWSNEKRKALASNGTPKKKQITLTLPERVEDGVLKVPETVKLSE